MYSDWYHARVYNRAGLVSVKSVQIDFHTHSSASDGALAPAELLRRARSAGIELMAITDHDTMAGYHAARAALDGAAGLRLIPGVELSCRWAATTIHVVGLGVDSDHPAMEAALQLLGQARRERGETIARRLAALGFPGALEGAMRQAGESQLGRPHFAAWLVESGHVEDVARAFDKYLGQGKRGDVKAFWPELADAVGWITAAGGVAVLAHPLKYRFTRMKLQRLAMDFRAAGGSALEIISGRQTPDQVAQLQRLARELELEVSVGSDFHRDSAYGPQLGVKLPTLKGLRGVWERFEAAPDSRKEDP